jgi:hypothetical protein
MARVVEVFIAGTPLCDAATALVRRLADPGLELRLMNMRTDPVAQKKAKAYRLKSLPAVVVDGALFEGGASGVDEVGLRQLGLGKSIAAADTDRIDARTIHIKRE